MTGGFQMKKLRFIGIDYWDRPVYRDESGDIWKDVNLRKGNACTSSYPAVLGARDNVCVFG